MITLTYDNLSRLLTASTTQASSTPFKHSFNYTPIGNMRGMATTGATTSYTYAETGSTNPSAPTTIGGASLTYDTNGNALTYGVTRFTWDYRNRMTATWNGVATTTYAYDHTFERVKKVFGATTTYYINDLYNKAGATTTIYIYDNTGTLIATIEGNGTATTTEYQHQDHLGGTQVLTSAYGNVLTTLDYYPYGDTRISSGSFTSKRNFIGEVQDLETDLNYLNARYYDSARGQFLSQDQVFLELGVDQRSFQLLLDPQQANSYSYARNNPITLSDPSGEALPIIIYASLAVAAALFVPDEVVYAPAPGEEDKKNSFYETSLFLLNLASYNKSKTGQSVVQSIVKKSEKSAINSTGPKIGQSFGKLGKVVEAKSGKVTLINDHALLKGMTPTTIKKVVNNPLVVLDQGDRFLYLHKTGAVVVDSKGRVITSCTKDYFKPEIIEILKKVK